MNTIDFIVSIYKCKIRTYLHLSDQQIENDQMCVC